MVLELNQTSFQHICSSEVLRNIFEPKERTKYHFLKMKFLVLAILVAAVSADVRDVLNKNDAAYNYQKPQQQQQQPQAEQNYVDTELSSLPDQKYSQPQAAGPQSSLQAGPTALPSFAQGAQNVLPAFAAQVDAPLAPQAPLPSQAPLAPQAPLQNYVAPQAASAQLNLQAGPTALPSFAQSAQNSLPAFAAQAQAPFLAQALQNRVAPQAASGQLNLQVGPTQLPSFAENTLSGFAPLATHSFGAQTALPFAQAYNFDAAQYNQYSLPLQYSQLPIQYQTGAYAFPAAYSSFAGDFASFPASYSPVALQSYSGLSSLPASLPSFGPTVLPALAEAALPQQRLSLHVSPTSLPSFESATLPALAPTSLPSFDSSAQVLPAEFNLSPEVQFKSEPAPQPLTVTPAPQPIKYDAPKPTQAVRIAPQPIAPQPIAPLKPLAPQPIVPKPIAPLPIAPLPIAPQPIAPLKPLAPLAPLQPIPQQRVAPFVPQPPQPQPFSYSDSEGYNYNKPSASF